MYVFTDTKKTSAKSDVGIGISDNNKATLDALASFLLS